MGLLVGAMDIATANNTVAIVMANPIAKEMALEYRITSRKTASILDTFFLHFPGGDPIWSPDAGCHFCGKGTGI